jgi:lysophospholipase L1-like esterase
MVRNRGSYRQLVMGLALVVGTLAWSMAAKADVQVKQGQKIAFLGDSITQGGMGPTGYVSLVVSGLKANGINVGCIGAGISGHKSNQMLERLERDVIAKKPDWMTLSCGVNDVWHGEKGVPLDKYKENITAIVDRAQAAGIKVMLLTATVIGEDVGNDNNKKLIPYTDFLRQLAKEKGCLLADLNADMQKGLEAGEKAGKKRGNMLTSDGVHMNVWGNQVMAAGIIRAFGLSDEQMTKAKDAWLDIPNGVTVSPRVNLTLRQYQALEAAAAREGKSVDAMMQAALDKAMAEMLKK